MEYRNPQWGCGDRAPASEINDAATRRNQVRFILIATVLAAITFTLTSWAAHRSVAPAFASGCQTGQSGTLSGTVTLNNPPGAETRYTCHPGINQTGLPDPGHTDGSAVGSPNIKAYWNNTQTVNGGTGCVNSATWWKALNDDWFSASCTH